MQSSSNDISIKPSVKVGAVKESIENALKRDAEIDAENIKVTAHEGKVTLSGYTHSWNKRDDAGEAAWRAPGVPAVQNDRVVSYY